MLEEYQKQKHICEGFITKDDAIKYNNNKNIDIINNITTYEKALSFDEFMEYLGEIHNETNYNKCLMIYNKIEQMSTNTPQLITTIRLMRNKYDICSKYIINNEREEIIDDGVYHIKIMKCPHCGNRNKSLSKTNYIICGYNERGYDESGCGKDWCFKCGKILCKNWKDHELNLMTNRYHDAKCCIKHAKKYDASYDNYCQCLNLYVCRH